MSTPWPKILKLCEAHIADQQKKLEKVKPEDLQRLQGEIAGIRWVLTLPDRLTNPEESRIEN